MASTHVVGRRHLLVQEGASGSLIDIEVERDDGVKEVKRKVAQKLGVSIDRFQTELLARGRALSNSAPLTALDIQEGEPLLLTRGLSRSLSTPCLVPDEEATCRAADDDEHLFGLSPLDESLGCSSGATTSSCGSPRACGDSASLSLEMVCRMRPGPRRSEQEALVADAMSGVRGGACPRPLEEGLGGSYLFSDMVGTPVGVLKPSDEEPLAPNNPKGFAGRSLGQPGIKRTIRVGEAALREVAAFLLDHDGFANVPCTALVRATHAGFLPGVTFSPTSPLRFARTASKTNIAKLASFQRYAPHSCDANDYGAARFPVAGIHRIGILDLRILNIDRHAGNILVNEPRGGAPSPTAGGLRGGLSTALAMPASELTLVPIDHGFCLPETLEDPYFEWLHWPQASLPFSQEELDYIADLDVDADVDLLQRELPMLRTDCLRVLTVTTTLLKAAAAAEYTLSHIGQLMTQPTALSKGSRGSRRSAAQLSPMERLCMDALLASVPSARWSAAPLGLSVDLHAKDASSAGSASHTHSLSGTPVGGVLAEEADALFDFDDDAEPPAVHAPPLAVHAPPPASRGPAPLRVSLHAHSKSMDIPTPSLPRGSPAMDVPTKVSKWDFMHGAVGSDDADPELEFGAFGGVQHPQVSLAAAARLGNVTGDVSPVRERRGTVAGARWMADAAPPMAFSHQAGVSFGTRLAHAGSDADSLGACSSGSGGRGAHQDLAQRRIARSSQYVSQSGAILFGQLSDPEWRSFRRELERQLPAFLAAHAGVHSAGVLGAVPLSTSCRF